jgi:hypothetical protein
MLLLLLGFGVSSVPRRVVSFFFVVDFANDSLLAKKQLSKHVTCSSSFVDSILFRIYSKPQGKGCKEPAEENIISVGTTFQPR